jgi:hypothetical protein
MNPSLKWLTCAVNIPPATVPGTRSYPVAPCRDQKRVASLPSPLKGIATATGLAKLIPSGSNLNIGEKALYPVGTGTGFAVTVTVWHAESAFAGTVRIAPPMEMLPPAAQIDWVALTGG